MLCAHVSAWPVFGHWTGGVWLVLKPEAEDPRMMYTTVIKELVSRAPILLPNGRYTQDFLSDRELVWNKLSALTRGHDCWSYIRPAQKATDGRDAFMRLKGHFLGKNNSDNMAAEAKNKLRSTHYHGEQHQFCMLHEEPCRSASCTRWSTWAWVFRDQCWIQG